MNYRLIREIVGKKWAISPLFLSSMGTILQKFLEEGKPYAYDDYEESIDYSQENDQPHYNIVSVRGALLKNDSYSGRIGMRSMGKKIKQADSQSDILGHILIIDSPGGTVDGTRDLVHIIQKTQKPIVALIDGQADSAAYWIASATDKIIAMDDFAEVGSIGVMLSFMDVQPYYEKQGVKFHRIYSNYSSEKNKNFEEILKGNYKKYIEENLDPLAIEFRTSVQTNRQLLETQLTGKTFFAKDVLGTMVDQIGSIDDAKLYITENSNKMAENTPTTKSNNFLFRVFGKSLGKDIKTEEDLFEAQSDKIADLEKEISELKAKNISLEEESEKIAKMDNESKEMLSTAQERISELEAENKKLKELPGDNSAKAPKATDGNTDPNASVVSDEKSFIENMIAVKESYLD